MALQPGVGFAHSTLTCLWLFNHTLQLSLLGDHPFPSISSLVSLISSSFRLWNLIFYFGIRETSMRPWMPITSVLYPINYPRLSLIVFLTTFFPLNLSMSSSASVQISPPYDTIGTRISVL